MTITCDTPIENLLDINEIRNLVNEYESTATTETNELLTTISNEQKSGLSSDAFSLDNDSLLHTKSKGLVTELSGVSSDIAEWKNKILEQAEEKRNEEFTALKTAVYNKLVDLSEEIFKLNLQNIVKKSPEITSRLETIKALHKKYSEKYNRLLEMKE